MNREELLKIAKPILFNTEMVKAILDERKTVTRRNPFKFEMKGGCNPDWSGYSLGEYYTGHIDSGVCLYSRGTHDVWGVRSNVVKPKYKAGDILYVRETYCELCYVDENRITHYDQRKYYYKTDGDYQIDLYDDNGFYLDDQRMKWHPSIHMPKVAARIFLRVADVRVERLQDITEEECYNEGFEFKPPCLTLVGENYCDLDGPCSSKIKYCDMSTGELFGKLLWDSTIKKQELDKYGWSANPWVWVIEFERVDINGQD